jgi:glycosyltransferase involved in cell wall biosynthesis
VHPDLVGAVRRLSQRGDRTAPTLLRYSIWSASVEAVLERPPARLGLVYHNVTPARFLRDANPRIAALCARARAGLASLAPAVDVALADSVYNARELEEAGFAAPRVVPLLLDLPSRRAVDPEPGEGPVVISVGRVAPNKRLDLLVRAFALFQRAHAPGASLALVGPWDGFETYRDALDRFVTRLGATGVRFLGRVGDAERDAWYQRAHAYACASAHEGFCAPLVEAMAVGLPVVAMDAAAVPETLGAGGLVLPGADPCVLAEGLAEVTGNPALRAALADGAARRLAELAPDRVAGGLRDAIVELAGAP